jgi:acyl carrier protein
MVAATAAGEGMIREAIAEIAAREVGWRGPLPEGELGDALDSIARLALVVGIEDRFGIALEPAEDSELRTVDDVVRVIRRNIAHAA